MKAAHSPQMTRRFDFHGDRLKMARNATLSLRVHPFLRA
jgi:hypothetical protein